MRSLLCLPFLLLFFPGDRPALICRTWKQVGFKGFHKEYRPIDASLAEVITFRSDGTYDKLLYGQLSIKGEWRFDQDSSKLNFSITSINGAPIADNSLKWGKPIDTIVKLTKDTLIYGTLAYYGVDKEYGRDDLYLVPAGQ